jgi:protein-S-isoprenylcysteine O-methyltransferase Ste14
MAGPPRVGRLASDATELPVLRLDSVRLIVFGRVLPAAFFAWLAYAQILRLIITLGALPDPATVGSVVSGPLPSFLYLCFCIIPVFIYLGRPAPRKRDGRLVPRALALAGTLTVLVIGALPQGTELYAPAPWIRALSTGFSVLAFTTIVSALLYLRRNLSLIPEARALVVGGPYRVIRHPLYAAEIVATLAFAIVDPTVLVVAALVPFIVIQVLRSRYEERLLTDAFRQYAPYASRTRRLVPFLW